MEQGLAAPPRQARRAARVAALVALALVAAAAPLASTACAVGRRGETPLERRFREAIAEVRIRYGRSPLRADARLTAASRVHSIDMVERDYFAHGAFWRRDEAQGVVTGRVGETLGWVSGASDPVRWVVRAWLASPEHRAILLDPRYRGVGVGVARGVFLGHRDAVVVTADFHAP